MFIPPFLLPFVLIFAITLGVITYCSQPEILPKAYWERSEKICRAETGYLEAESHGNRAPCYALIYGHLDSLFMRQGRFPDSLDSFLAAHRSACFPLGIEKEISYYKKPGNAGYQLDTFSRESLAPLYQSELNRLSNSEATTEKYRACMVREGPKRWAEYRLDKSR